jgi:hypothetical protein
MDFTLPHDEFKTRSRVLHDEEQYRSCSSSNNNMYYNANFRTVQQENRHKASTKQVQAVQKSFVQAGLKFKVFLDVFRGKTRKKNTPRPGACFCDIMRYRQGIVQLKLIIVKVRGFQPSLSQKTLIVKVSRCY